MTFKKTVKRMLPVIVIISVAIALSGCSLFPKESQEELLPPIKPPALSQKPTYTVSTATLESKITGIGKVMSTKQESLFFTFSADDSSQSTVQTGTQHIKELYVQSGDKVKQGQLIAEVDTTDLQDQLREMKLDFSQDENQMKKTLRTADQMDPDQLEEAKIAFEKKRQAIVDLEEAINRSKITAPFDGTIVSVSKRKGDTVQAYDEVAVIADMTQLTVAAKFSTADLQKIALGMEATVAINSAGSFTGKVSRLPNPSSQGNQNQNQYPPYGNGNQNQNQDSIDDYLLVALDPFPDKVTLNTPLSVTIVDNKIENAIVIPPSTLNSISGRNYVTVVDDKGNKREVDVEVGMRTSTQVQIVKGLEKGQKVVGR